MLGFAIAGGGYVLLLGALYGLQRRLLFPAPLPARPIPATLLLRLPRPGLPEVLVLYRPALPGRPTVVHFHGNGEQLADQVDLGEAFAAAGLGFYAPEYPGYGLAGGESSEESIFAVATLALRHLHEALKVPVAQTVLEGHSLGSGVAAEMALRGEGARLILLSPYTSIAARGAQLFPVFPVRWLVRDRFDTLSKASQIALPVLIAHGARDRLIPVAMGRALAKAFPNARYLELSEAQHNDLLSPQFGLLPAIVAFLAATQ